MHYIIIYNYYYKALEGNEKLENKSLTFLFFFL